LYSGKNEPKKAGAYPKKEIDTEREEEELDKE
jgi:hypothetical protein